MTVVLPDDGFAMQFPQPSIVVRACRDKVCRIGAESTVPDPALMTLEGTFQLERLGALVVGLRLAGNGDHGFEVFDFPDLSRVVRGASGEVLDVWREEDTGDVVLVCGEVCDWDEGGLFAVLNEVPDVNIARIGACAERRAITCNGNASNRNILLRNELMGAVVLGKIPNANAASTITSNDLALVWMDDYIRDRRAMGIASLNRATPGLPDLNSSILRTCDHPFSLTVECDTCNVASMTFESKERVWIRGLDVIELNGMVASGGKKALVGGYAKTVDLRVGVLNCARANTGERFPEAYCMVVTSCTKNDTHAAQADRLGL